MGREPADAVIAVYSGCKVSGKQGKRTRWSMRVETKFIADCNVGKLARLLRMMGYDTAFVHDIDDDRLIELALGEDRVLLTRDRQLEKRRVVTNGQLRMVLVQQDDPREQLRQVIESLNLSESCERFSRCLECNHELLPRKKEDVRDLVPPYVFRTQTLYVQCPECQRVYWRGTHWEKMSKELERLTRG